MLWGPVAFGAQLLARPWGMRADPGGGGLLAGCLVSGSRSWDPGSGRTGPWQLATPGLHCYCRFLNGLLPFGFTELWCNPGQFACRSGTIQCIPLPWQCDGWVTCEDESDEADCPGECVGQAEARDPCVPLGDGVIQHPTLYPCAGRLF